MPKMEKSQTAPKPGVVQIRLAKTAEDVQAVMELGRRMIEETPFHKRFPFKFDPKRPRQQVWLGRMEKRGDQFGLFMAEIDGDLVGIIIAQIGSHLHMDVPVAQVVAFYVRPEHRGGFAAVKLIKGCNDWAQAKGAATMGVNVTTGVRLDTTDRFLRRAGFRQTGGNYEMVLNADALDAAVERSMHHSADVAESSDDD